MGKFAFFSSEILVFDIVDSKFFYQKILITVASGGQRIAVKKMLEANKIEYLFVSQQC